MSDGNPIPIVYGQGCDADLDVYVFPTILQGGNPFYRSSHVLRIWRDGELVWPAARSNPSKWRLRPRDERAKRRAARATSH